MLVERQQLYSRIATHIRIGLGEVAQNQKEAETKTSHPVHRLFVDALSNTSGFKNLPWSRSRHLLGYRQQRMLDTRYDSIADATDKLKGRIYNTYEYVQPPTNDNDYFDYVFLAAAAAVVNLPPEGYSGGKVGKPKDETSQHLAFRLAIGKIRNLASQTIYVGLSQQDLIDEVAFAKGFLEGLAKATFSAEDAREEFFEASRQYKDYEQRRAKWKLLPRQPREKHVVYERLLDEAAPGGVKDRMGIDDLQALVNEWGEGDVKEADFHIRGGNRYNVAVLPQVLPDDTEVEHAVLDDPRSGALFVWRAEKGIDDDGIIQKTWVDVFDHRYKPDAIEDGAKKINHSKYWRTRLMDYLTCSRDELDLVA